MAIKKIMVLSGVANAGKTNTLNMLAERLNANHRLLWVGGHRATIQPNTNVTMPNGHRWKDEDHWFVFGVTTGSQKKIVVAISTQGDNGSVCKAALDAFGSTMLSPEIVILASRSYWSSSVAAIENWNGNILPPYTAIMLKPNTSQRTMVEQSVVDRLYNEIV